MSSINKVILTGNLTRDPEIRYTPRGTAICMIGLACNRVWHSDSGEKMEKTTFVDISAFGRQGETIAQYFRKGQFFIMVGRLDLDQWQDKATGQNRSKLKVVLEEFTFPPSGSQRNETDSNGSRRQTEPATRAEASPQTTNDDAGSAPYDPDDDIPF